MSKETIAWLNSQTLIGYTDKRGPAWHRRHAEGTEDNHYTGAIPVEDVMRRLFHWQAVEGQITATADVITPDGVTSLTYTDPRRKAIMRSDTGAILGVTSDQYRIHQYDQWLIQNVATLLDADLAIASAGLLRGGAQAWVQIEMEDTLEVCGVQYRPFINAATSMDGGMASTYFTGETAIVCDNTLAAARVGAASTVKIAHTTNSLLRIADVRAALEIVHTTADTFAAEVQRLVDTKVSDAQWAKFVDAFVGGTGVGKSKAHVERKTSELYGLWNDDERVTPWKGTGYGVYAAANTWQTWMMRSRGPVAREDRNMTRFLTGEVTRNDNQTLALLDKVLAAKPAATRRAKVATPA